MKKPLGAKTFALPAPVWAIGAYDENGAPNVMIAAWGGICCSQPPCLSVAIRPSRHTFDGIVRNKAFTVSVPQEQLAAQADYLGMVSGKNVNKFTESGLTPAKATVVNAPYVEEFPLILECELMETHYLGIHTLLIGEIKEVLVDNDKLVDGKFPDIEKIRPLIFAPGSRTYHGVGKQIGQAFEMGKKFMKE